MDEAAGAAFVAFLACAAVLAALGVWLWAVRKFVRAQHPIAATAVLIGGGVVLAPVLLFAWVVFAHMAGWRARRFFVSGRISPLQRRKPSPEKKKPRGGGRGAKK